MRKNLDIEALRAFAISLTLIAHSVWLIPDLNAIVSYYWLGGGVDLFFCISGFVITSSLIRASSQSDSRQTFWSFAIPFWVRRIFRLWPASLFWICAILLCTTLINNSKIFGDFSNNLSASVAAIFQVQNFYYASCTKDGFTCAYNVLAVYWSLSLEEQFYLIFPFLFFFVKRRYFVVLLSAAIIMQFPATREWPSLLWFVRTDAICFGVLIALAWDSVYIKANRLQFLRIKFVRVTIVLTLLSMLAILGQPKIAFYHGWIAVVSALLVLIASFDQGYIVRNEKLVKFTSWLGSRSYSMYLIHGLAFYMCREIYFGATGNLPVVDFAGISLLFSSLVLLVVLSEFSVRVIERAARDYGRSLGDRIAYSALRRNNAAN